MTNKIGLLADPQYGSIPDAVSPDVSSGEERVQRYRLALEKTREALARMHDCAFVVNLGDIIQSDKTQTEADIEADFDAICSVFEADAHQKVLHALGNHCIGRLQREDVCRRLGIPLQTVSPFLSCFLGPPTSTSYYAHMISEAWMLIVLDTTEMSGHSGYHVRSRPAREAAAYLKNHPVDVEPHMIPWNGGCTQRQLKWLKSQLNKAAKDDVLVIVASHHPIHGGAARPSHLAWNHSEILSIVNASPNVRLVLSGHDHLGGACRQSCGRVSQLYVTVPAILEAAIDGTEYLVLDLEELARCTAGPDVGSSNMILSAGEKSRCLLERALGSPENH